MHRIVGLDIAQDVLRAAVLETSFRGFAVREVRTAPMPPEGTPTERLKAAIDALGLTPPLGRDDTVAVAVPGVQVATHLVSLPFTDARRIEQVLPAEVEGAIPFDVSEVVWDHAVVSDAGGRAEVLVGIVKANVLRELLDTLAAAGLDPRVVTFAPLALAAIVERGLVALPPQDGATGPALPTAAILDGGPERSDLTVLDGGRPALARGLTTASAAAWQGAADDSAAQSRLLNAIARDLKISLKARGGKVPQPGRLLLAGSLASMPGAADQLEAELRLPVGPVPVASGTPETALALGLALRAHQPRGKINFRKGAFAYTKDLSQVRGQLTKLVTAAAVLLVLGLGLGLARLSSLRSQGKAYDEALCGATRRILGTCLTDYRQALGRLSGGTSKAAGIPRVSAAEVFAELMAQFPEGAMPTLEDVEVTTTSIRVKGIAESFGKVDEIIAALKKDKCFGEIKQPRVERLRDGSKVSFSIDFPYTCSGEHPGGA